MTYVEFKFFAGHYQGSLHFLLFVLVLCTFLFGVSIGEKKVSVSEVVFDSAVEDIQWLGVKYDIVLCRTSSGRLYRSLDSGRNWSEITEHLRRVAVKSRNSEVVVERIVVSPVDKDIVLIAGKKKNHFISINAGRTFRLIEHTGSIHNFLFHPTNPNWALMSRWTDACEYPSERTKNPCRHDLFVTKNLGATFKLIVTYVVQFSWGDKKLNMQDAIFFSHFVEKQLAAQPRTGGWSERVHFSMVKYPGAARTELVTQGNKFLLSNGYIFVAKLLQADRQTVSLMVSTDGGRSFNAAKLPIELQERSYTVLDTSEESVILHVNHGHDSSDSGINVGNVYISDKEGLRYSLSIPKNVRTVGGECEFDKVASLDGIYIANFKEDRTNVNDSSSSTTADDFDNGLFDDSDLEMDAYETGIDRRQRQRRKGKDEAFIKTVITFDKGGVWSYLRPPKIDSRGKKIDCFTSFSRPSASNFTDAPIGSNCWLHLHGITNFHRFAPFYSVPSAVGIIMGTGNVGESLRYEEDQVNTYLSRDGGLTWVEAHKGGYIYEFGDHGGLVVMADDMKKTNQVVFSWNEGQSWYDFDLGEQLLNVDNVVIEPNSSSVEFLLYGTRGSAGVLYHLDFATLDQPACKGIWAADSVSSDYETWTATDGRTGENCLMGRQLTFTRRKQTSECFNGVDFNRPVEKKNCTCTEHDYECEFGFTRNIESLECKPESATLSQEGCISSGLFMADAYRKIPGNSCVNGWVPSKVAVSCPASSPFSARARFVLLSIIGVVGALSILTFVNNDPRFKTLVSNIGFDSFSKARYAVVGGANRFLDAFDVPQDEAEQSHEYSNKRFDGADNLGFIESEQASDDIDAPPLLDFSSNAVHEPFQIMIASPSQRTSQSASEIVPRLQPPPNPNASIRELEML